MGRAAVTLLTQHVNRARVDRVSRNSPGSRRGEASIGVRQAPPPAAARPDLKKARLVAFEWCGGRIRTATTAPGETGLTLTGMRWLDGSPHHSTTFWSWRIRDIGFFVARQRPAEVMQRFAAAREPSVDSFPFTPIILSAIKQGNRRVVLPETISGGGDVFPKAGVPRVSLRSLRAGTSQVQIQLLSAGTQETLTGAAGVDTKTGAAIHATAAPGE